MQNEKLMILKMLESGQISADEASRLLQAADSGRATPPTPPSSQSAPLIPPPPPSPAPTGAGHGARYDGPASNNGRPPASGAAPSTMEDLGRKFESFARDMAPKVQKFAESAVGAIVGVTDKVSDAFSSPGSGSGHPAPTHGGQTHRPEPPRPAATAAGGVTVVNIEKLVEAGTHNELSISGLSGEVRIKGYNGDKITARLSYRAKRAGAHIELVKLGGKYFLNYESDEFSQVSIDAYVPERAFSVIKVDGINCVVDCSSLAANDMRIVNANGNVNLSGLSATTLTAENGNGRFSVSNIAADTATIENINGQLECTELDIANLKLTNYNSPISIIMSGFNRHTDYLWNVETGNAKLSMNMPTMPNLGYHIKAHAAMGEIRLGLTGLQFLINEPSLVEARSVSFDHASKKLKLAAETSNAPLTIS